MCIQRKAKHLIEVVRRSNIPEHCGAGDVEDIGFLGQNDFRWVDVTSKGDSSDALRAYFVESENLTFSVGSPNGTTVENFG